MGSLQLAGALAVNIEGLEPDDEDIFDIIRYDLDLTGDLLGEFSGFTDDERYFSLDGLYSFVIDYNFDPLLGRVVLRDFESVAVPEPAIFGPITLSGLLILTRRKRALRTS